MPKSSELCRQGQALNVARLAAVIAGIGVGPVLAQDQSIIAAQLTHVQFAKETGGAARIDIASQLRMIPEAIAAEACIYATHADDDLAAADLIAKLEEFSKFVKALEIGDESLGVIGPEGSAKVLKGLKVLADEWAPMQAAAKDLLASGGDNAAALAIIYEQEPKVLKITQKFSTEVSAVYADPNSLSTASALVIDIASRQEMLLEKMVKEACQISTGAAGPETLESLKTTVSNFDVTMTALINGMPEAGVPPPPTPQIRAELEAIQAEWQTVRAPIDAVLAGTSLDGPGLSALLVSSDELLKGFVHVVGAYAAAATY
jgi:hypothetical protein